MPDETLKARIEALPRLRPVQYDGGIVGTFARMQPHESGQYVKLSDVLAALASLPTEHQASAFDKFKAHAGV